MKSLGTALALGLGGAVAFSSPVALAQSPTSSDELVEEIIREVIDETVGKARQEVLRNTDIDPFERGYDQSRQYEPVPSGAAEETTRELRLLNEEHDREIRQLEEELQRKLERAQAEFEREAAREDKPERVEEKRRRLEQKVDNAYEMFEHKIEKRNEHYDDKRDRILSKPGGN